jgi:prepilin-type N-terminal cleavage/methylation domain-containing protein/prepilin-type processing-associated H-X9-DG protein
MMRRKGFTLVELLVVIGIIAVLISILLPSLNAARQSANSVKCLSNLRQLATGATMMAAERKGVIQPATANAWFMELDPQRTKFVWRNDGQAQDWASTLAKYIGRREPVENLMELSKDTLKIYQCPSDNAQAMENPGYWLYSSTAYTDLAATGGYLPISYGINADIAAVTRNNGEGRFDDTHVLGVYKGPNRGPYGTSPNGAPLNGKLSKVADSTRTMLFADCGTRGDDGRMGIENGQALAYSSHWTNDADGVTPFPGTLHNMARASWMQNKIPLSRHDRKATDRVFNGRGRINVAFVDGHAESVGYADFKMVKISPYKY